MQARMIAGRYRLTRPLGRGGMGTVWLGEDELAGRQVAIKELRAPDGITDAERDIFRKRALQEARSAARLAHGNAVTLHDIIPATAADDAVYLIMEYVDGATLAQVIEREGPLTAARATDIARQLLSILAAAHALGIVHRDIKPANVMIAADGQVKLADFGIAHVVGGTRLTGSGIIGTPAYLAPEQLQGQSVTPAVDLWALGATLYTAVAGRNPFERDITAAIFHAILMADVPPPPCPPPLGTVIVGLLARDPAQRMTTDQARQVLSGQTAWSGLPGTGASLPGSGDAWGPSGSWPGRAAVPGPVTGPGASAYQASEPTSPGWPPSLADGGPQTPAGYTYPGGQSPGGQYPGGQYPSGPSTGAPPAGAPRRRTALIAAGAAAAAVAATLAVVLTVHGGSPGTGTPAASGTVTGQPADPAASHAVGTDPVATRTSGSGPGAVPAAYVGRWQGTLTDNSGLEGPQRTDLTLTGGAVHSVVGKVSYPDVGCTYDLQLLSAQQDRVELLEQVTSGACLADYAVLGTADTQTTENVYLTEPSGSSSPQFTGRLTKTAAG